MTIVWRAAAIFFPSHDKNVSSGGIFFLYGLKVEFSSSPASSVGRGSDYDSQGCGFESHCGQEFFILYFFALHALLAGRLVSYK